MLLTLWFKGPEHLEKWSKVVAPLGGDLPEELYDLSCSFDSGSPEVRRNKSVSKFFKAWLGSLTQLTTRQGGFMEEKENNGNAWLVCSWARCRAENWQHLRHTQGSGDAMFVSWFAGSPENFCDIFLWICLGICHWKILIEQMDAEGLGLQTAAYPPATPGEPPWKADCGYCDSISKNADPVSTFELFSMPALQREAAWAEERLLGDLWQSVHQNGRIHLNTHYRKNNWSF